MRVASALGSLSTLLLASQGVHADRVYFSINGSSYTSSYGSSSYSSFSFGTAPQVVQVYRPTTIIITGQQPTTVVTYGNGQCVTVCGGLPVTCRPGHRPCHGSTWHSQWPTEVGAPGGRYNTVPFGDRYPGFPYSHSWWGNTPSVAGSLPNWANSSTTQSFRTGWTLLGR